MIEIILKENGAVLPVPPDFNIVRSVQNNIFTKEVVQTEVLNNGAEYDYTIPVDIPLTDDAIVALGYPNHLGTSTYKYVYEAQVFIDGMFADNVSVRVLKVDTKKNTASISLYGSRASFAMIVGGAKLSDLTLGGIRTIGTLASDFNQIYPAENIGTVNLTLFYKGSDAATYIEQLMNGTATDDFTFYTAQDQKVNTLVDDNTSAYIFNSYCDQNVNISKVQDPMLVNLFNMASLTPVNKYYWVPFFYLHYVIRQVFSEYGFNVMGEILDDARFKAITLFNTFSINQCTVTEDIGTVLSMAYTAHITHDATKIDPRNHMPDIRIIDFLNEVEKTFNVRFVIDFAALTVSVSTLNSVTASPSIIDVTGIADPDFSVNNENPTDYTNGYKLTYTPDPNDAASCGTRMDDINFSNVVSPTNTKTFEQLALINGDGQPQPLFGFVQCENAWYKWSGIEWLFYADNLLDYNSIRIALDYDYLLDTDTEVPVNIVGLDADTIEEIEQKVQEVSAKICPMPMRFCDGPVNFLLEPFYTGSVQPIVSLADESFIKALMPTSSIGVTGSNMLSVNRSALYQKGMLTTQNLPFISVQPHICNFYGLQYANGAQGVKHSFGSAGNFDPQGNELYGYNLSISTPASKNNIYWQFWDKWVRLVAGSLPVDQDVLLDLPTYLKLDVNGSLLKKDGQLFLINQADINLNLPGVSRFNLVRI